MPPERVALEQLRPFCTGDSAQNSGAQKVDKKPPSKDQAWEVSSGKDRISCWTPDHVCYGLAESLSAFCSCPETLPETEIKGGGLINLQEEISRQPNIESVAWLLLGAFSQIYVANQEQKAQQDNLKRCEFGQKENSSKAVECKDRAKTSTVEKKQKNKDDKGTSQKAAGLYPLQPQNRKSERIFSEKKAAKQHAPEWGQRPHEVPKWRQPHQVPERQQHRKAFHCNQVDRAQQSRFSTPTTKREKSLATAPAGSKSWQHQSGTDFRCKENAQILRLRRLPPRVQKDLEAKQCVSERAICKDVRMKPKLQWRPQKFGKAKKVDYQRKPEKMKQRRLKRETSGAEIPGVESPKPFGACNQIASKAEHRTLGLNVHPDICFTCFVPMLWVPLIVTFGMVMFILCLCILEIFNRASFIQGITAKNLP